MNSNAIHLILLLSVSIILVTISSNQIEQTNHKLQVLCDRLNVLEFDTDIDLTDCDEW